MADNTPVGSIVMFGGRKDRLPSGWLYCNGDIVNQNEYQDLWGKALQMHPHGTYGYKGQRLRAGGKALKGKGESRTKTVTLDLPARAGFKDMTAAKAEQEALMAKLGKFKE